MAICSFHRYPRPCGSEKVGELQAAAPKIGVTWDVEFHHVMGATWDAPPGQSERYRNDGIEAHIFERWHLCHFKFQQ